MPVQFPYPNMPWSEGFMRKAKYALPQRGNYMGQDWKEIEGERKKRETKASDAGTILGNGPTQMAQVTDERRQQLQYEMEAGYQSKITPEEFEAFNDVKKAWDALDPAERIRRRKWYQDQEKSDQEMYQMSPKQLREQGVTPGPQ